MTSTPDEAPHPENSPKTATEESTPSPSSGSSSGPSPGHSSSPISGPSSGPPASDTASIPDPDQTLDGQTILPGLGGARISTGVHPGGGVITTGDSPAGQSPSSPGSKPSQATKPSQAIGELTVRSGGQAQTEADYPPDLRSFGDYDLESEIARGGMGVVYRARQKSLNRIVALKMILSGRFAGPDELRRFREEAGAAARLDHPCIVPIYEVGQHQGQHYFSMGLVDGQSMDHWLRRGPMQVDIAAAMLRSIAAAMAYAHSKGVVHRDLKPANILIAEADSSASQSLSPRITDFGLAKQTGRDDMTGTGQILGTPSYMAPEQATGNTDAVGPLSDVYSIGAIGYAMVTGGPPFRGATTMDTLRQVIDREPAPPRQLNSAVPRDLETILLKCLNKDPRKRYEDAAALTSDLERFIEGGEIQARPISRIERFGRTLYRHRVAAALTSSTLLLLLVMAICGPLLALSENRARSSAETALRDAKAARANAEIEKQRAQEASEEAQRQRDATEVASQKLAEQTQKNLADLYAGEIHWAYRSWTDGAVRRMRNRLQRSPEDQRGWEWDFLDQLPEANTRLLQGHNSAVGQVVVDADGKTLSTVGEDRYILKWDLASGKMIQRRSQAAAFNRISPDAQTRLSITPAGLSVADIESSDAIVVDPVADDSIVDLRWSADGRTAAMLCQNQSDAWLRLINVPLVRDQRFDATMLLPVVPIPATGDTCLTLAVSNDGTIIWVGTQNGRLHRFNRSSKKWNETPAAKNADASTAFAEFNEPISALTQSADTQKHSTEELSTQKYNIQGQTLWVGTQRGSVFKLDARDGSILQTRRRQLRPIRAIALSPDRRLAAIAGDFTQVQLWETERLDEVHRLAGASDRYDDVAFTRDSNSLVGCGDSGVNVWKLESSITSGLESLTRDYRVAVDTRRQPLTMCPAGRPGAAWLLDRSGSVDLWDIREHRPIRRLRAAVVGEIATAIAVSGDGDEVAVALQPTRGDANARIEVWGTLAEEKRRTLQTSVRQIDSLIAMPERPGWIAAGGSVTQQPGGIDDNSVADRPGQREIKTAIELEQPSKILVFRNQDTRATAQWFARSPRWNRLARIPGQSHIVATSDDGKVSRIDVETGQIVREMRAMIQIQFSDVTASPDGQRVAAIGNDRRLRIWNGDDGVLETVIEQAGTGFYGLRFLSPNRLTTVSDDGFMRIWRVEDGAEVLRLPTGTSSPRGWIVTPDAGAILLTSGDHAIRSWSLRRSLSNDADPWDTNVWDTSGAAIADRDAQSQQPSDALDKRIQLIDLQTGQIDSIAQRSKPNDAPANGIISENGQWTRRDDATTVRMTASINAGSATLSSATRTYGGFRLPERYSFGLRFQSDGPMGLFMGLLDDQGSMLGASFQSERNPLDNTRGISLDFKSSIADAKDSVILGYRPELRLEPNTPYDLRLDIRGDAARITLNGSTVVRSTIPKYQPTGILLSCMFGAPETKVRFESATLECDPGQTRSLEIMRFLADAYQASPDPILLRQSVADHRDWSVEDRRMAASLIDNFSFPVSDLARQTLDSLSSLRIAGQGFAGDDVDLATANGADNDDQLERVLQLARRWQSRQPTSPEASAARLTSEVLSADVASVTDDILATIARRSGFVPPLAMRAAAIDAVRQGDVDRARRWIQRSQRMRQASSLSPEDQNAFDTAKWIDDGVANTTEANTSASETNASETLAEKCFDEFAKRRFENRDALGIADRMHPDAVFQRVLPQLVAKPDGSLIRIRDLDSKTDDSGHDLRRTSHSLKGPDLAQWLQSSFYLPPIASPTNQSIVIEREPATRQSSSGDGKDDDDGDLTLQANITVLGPATGQRIAGRSYRRYRVRCRLRQCKESFAGSGSMPPGQTTSDGATPNTATSWRVVSWQEALLASRENSTGTLINFNAPQAAEQILSLDRIQNSPDYSLIGRARTWLALGLADNVAASLEQEMSGASVQKNPKRIAEICRSLTRAELLRMRPDDAARRIQQAYQAAPDDQGDDVYRAYLARTLTRLEPTDLAPGISAAVPIRWRDVTSEVSGNVPGDLIRGFQTEELQVLVSRVWTSDSMSIEDLVEQFRYAAGLGGFEFQEPKEINVGGRDGIEIQFGAAMLKKSLGPQATDETSQRILLLPRSEDLFVMSATFLRGEQSNGFQQWNQFLNSLRFE